MSKRLSIDYGVRWTWAGEMHPNNPGQQSVFMRNLYTPGQAPPLYAPVTQNGVRYAQNPLTGALLPQAYVGLFVPGVGNPAPGGVTYGDKNVPERLRQSAAAFSGDPAWDSPTMSSATARPPFAAARRFCTTRASASGATW